MRKKILIYRSRLLPLSETFVYDHWRNLKSFDGYFAGIRLVEGINIPQERVFVQFKKRPGIGELIKFLNAPQHSFLCEQVAALKPDIIHAHFAIDAVEALPLAKKLGIPLIVTLHGYDINSSTKSHFTSGSPYRLNYLVRRGTLAKEANLFLPVSDYVKQAALKKLYPTERMKTHILGIDRSMFENDVRARQGILFVGRIVEKKGLEYLIRAFATLPLSEVRPPLRIIGDGPLLNKMERLAKALKVDAVFLGKQPRDRVRTEMARARILCMPSVLASSGDNEGLPIVALEAQASGCPVVAFNQGPIPAAVRDGITGLLARDGDVNDLALCINRLLIDDELNRQMSVAGPRFIAENFDIVRQTERLERIYSEILGDL